MPFSSGTYTLPSGNPVVSGTTIQSSWANTTLSDIGTALSTCVLKDGTQTITANIPMSNFKVTGLGSATALTDAANLGQIQSGAASYLTGVAGTNTVTATATPAATLAVGQRFWLIPAATNTGAVTLQIGANSAGAVQINGGALVGGEMTISVPVEVIVTATTPVFEIIGDGGFLNKNITQTANRVFSGPSSGSAAIPTFRALVQPDIAGLQTTLTGFVTTTTGTTITIISGISTAAKRVTINMHGTSTNGTNPYFFQIGPITGVEQSGYNAIGGTTVFSSGIGVPSGSASNNWYGSIILTLSDTSTNTWSFSGAVSTAIGPTNSTISGTKPISGGALGKLSLTTQGGVDIYDSGSVSALIETF